MKYVIFTLKSMDFWTIVGSICAALALLTAWYQFSRLKSSSNYDASVKDLKELSHDCEQIARRFFATFERVFKHCNNPNDFDGIEGQRSMMKDVYELRAKIDELVSSLEFYGSRYNSIIKSSQDLYTSIAKTVNYAKNPKANFPVDIPSSIDRFHRLRMSLK